MKDKILKILQKKKYRLTYQRKRIFDVLTHYPQSVLDIVNSLKKQDLNFDKVTVYRTLKLLVKLGIVSKTQFADKTARYELIKEDNNHHHHLVCLKCGFVEDVILEEKIFLHRVCQQTDFQIKSHTLEFYGLCTLCQRL